MYWEFWENFRKFWKFSSENCKKYIILAYFSNNLTNFAFIFCAFGRKTQIVGKSWENFEIFWWKFLRKIEFFIFLENLLLKIELSEITPFFYNIFFGFGGGFPPSPLATPLIRQIAGFSWRNIQLGKLLCGQECRILTRFILHTWRSMKSGILQWSDTWAHSLIRRNLEILRSRRASLTSLFLIHFSNILGILV